ncbi:PepSY domain-containing protein [Methylocystis sp.]|uniref:PepSY-associated TM helix domain-containing protein n=1 Tax=Methylocystis sp. TaxID=1911079 RepID=UPI0025FD8371|nr:PepSY-associated TM helix domain-containing protein [Methylocystis sp.]
MTRAFFVWLHRWAGLAMAGFLIVVGLTGSLLAFYGELNHLLTPELYPAARDGAALDAATLARRAEEIVPGAQTTTVYFGYDAPVAEIGMEAAAGAPTLNFSTLYLDRYSGAELGRMFWGAVPTSRAGIMPFVYQLHMTLVAGEIGAWILGLTALAWTLDSFVGFYLTLPAPSERSRKGFFSRWKPAWLVKLSGSFYRVNFDLHRASGLWLWAMLFIYAWSSVYMNLNGFYSRAMSLLFEFQTPYYRVEAQTSDVEPMSWEKAQETGRALMAEAARKDGFSVEREVSLYAVRDKSAWEYRVRSSRDIGDKYGQTSVWFDIATGELRQVSLPTGGHAGNTITTWIYELHKANLFGLPYRIFVCALGLVIVMLSGTGVYIWWKKRSARLAHVRRTEPRPAPAERTPA